MNPDNITRAMAAVIRATSATSDWAAQQKLLAAYDRLAEARRASMRGNTNREEQGR